MIPERMLDLSVKSSFNGGNKKKIYFKCRKLKHRYFLMVICNNGTSH
jgi:hypothetical protein